MMRPNRQYHTEIAIDYNYFFSKEKYSEGTAIFIGNGENVQRPEPKFVYELMNHYIRLLNRNGNKPFCTFHNFYNFDNDLPASFFREILLDDRNSIVGVYERFYLKDRVLEVYTREKKGKRYARIIVSDITEFGKGNTIEAVERRV